jgi:hypothetical protein
MAISQINSNSLASGVPSSANLPAGSVLQVVNGTYGTETNNNTSTWIDTGLTASITPTKSSSKILVLINHAGSGKDNSNTRLGLRLLRGATVLVQFEENAAYSADAGGNFIGGCSNCYYDSPATTSLTTYKTQQNSYSNTSGSRTQQGGVSSITLMEIAQ